MCFSETPTIVFLATSSINCAYIKRFVLCTESLGLSSVPLIFALVLICLFIFLSILFIIVNCYLLNANCYLAPKAFAAFPTFLLIFSSTYFIPFPLYGSGGL